MDPKTRIEVEDWEVVAVVADPLMQLGKARIRELEFTESQLGKAGIQELEVTRTRLVDGCCGANESLHGICAGRGGSTVSRLAQPCSAST